MLRGIFRTKNLDDILAAAQEEGHKLKRTLGPINITLLGIGAIIGAGIFATVGTAAAGDASRPGAGPSLMLSFGIPRQFVPLRRSVTRKWQRWCQYQVRLTLIPTQPWANWWPGLLD